jgi:hypothetical protein
MALRTQEVLLTRRCPICAGRSEAVGKLPLSQGIRTVELNLDEPARLVKELSLHLLLSLVELLPYKQFACRRCGHEFRLASQSTRAMMYDVLVSMQPVAPALAPKPSETPMFAPRPRGAPAKVQNVPPPEVVAPARAKARPKAEPEAPSRQPRETPPDWTPYHLDSDMDALFDQFKEGD